MCFLIEDFFIGADNQKTVLGLFRIEIRKFRIEILFLGLKFY